MESMMKKIGKILESKDMSIEEMNKYLVGKDFDEIEAEYNELHPEATPKERAEDLILEAMEETSRRERKRLAKEALEIYPNSADAFIILAEEAGSPEEALQLCERAMQAGYEDLGAEFFEKNEGHFWGITETRPYMRAKSNVAQLQWGLGKEDEAIANYKECLKLNPNDNQGVRDPLLTYLLIKNDLDGAEQILNQYNDDVGASHEYNKALWLYKKYGSNSNEANEQLRHAIEENKYVPPYLLGNQKLPLETPDSYSIGGKDEAMIYAEEAMRAWNETPGALKWLAEIAR